MICSWRYGTAESVWDLTNYCIGHTISDLTLDFIGCSPIANPNPMQTDVVCDHVSDTVYVMWSYVVIRQTR